MIRKTLKENREIFGISTIFEENNLGECKRTSFTWSELPNTLCLATDKEYFQEALDNNNIRGIVTTPVIISQKEFGKAVIVSEKASELFYFLHNMRIHDLHESPKKEHGIHPSSTISDDTTIGENVLIGKNVVIHDGCIVLDNTIIRDNSVLYHNVTIGTQGFFSKIILGKKTHIEHFGGVKIGENCIVHTGTNISRSVNSDEYTEIGNNVHIGIHSNIGHDCKIEENCDISAKVFLSGKVKIGTGCWIGASVAISNSVSVGANASIKIGSVVIDDIQTGHSVSGNFAYDHARNLKEFLKIKKR
jgi:UDP-3-O-[3-hydroxymyristoyl] glucosamine N-acyltransferase